jgi:hypothetical protein
VWFLARGKVFLLITYYFVKVHLHHFSKIKSQKEQEKILKDLEERLTGKTRRSWWSNGSRQLKDTSQQ